MGSYEGLRQIRQTAGLATLLTPQMFAGDFSQTSTIVKDPLNGNTPFPGNQIPATRISPVVAAASEILRHTHLPGLNNNLSYSAANNNNTDQTVDRVDQNFGSQRPRLLSIPMAEEDLLAGAALPSSASTGTVDTHNYGIGYTQIFTPNLVNDMRFGKQWFKTSTLNYFYVSGLTHAGCDLGIPGFNGDVVFNNPGIPEFNVTGFTGWGNSGSNWFQDDSTWQGSDQLSWTHGAHNIIGGVELRKLETGRAAQNSPRGAFNFNGQYSGYAPADFVLGLIQSDTTDSLEVRGLVAEWRDGFFVPISGRLRAS